MMPPAFLAAHGVERVVASGNCVARNKPVMLDALRKAFAGAGVELAEDEGGIGGSSAVGAALFVL